MSTEILIIGASGFIGSNLLQEFESTDTEVNVLARTPSKIYKTKDTTHVFQGDLEDPSTIESALEGVKIIYYLAHSMSDSADDFKDKEIKHAKKSCRPLK
jgi:uncharacterized protein YbjT (DUF2867 family)